MNSKAKIGIESKDLINHLTEAVKEIKYGYIELVIQD